MSVPQYLPPPDAQKRRELHGEPPAAAADVDDVVFRLQSERAQSAEFKDADRLRRASHDKIHRHFFAVDGDEMRERLSVGGEIIGSVHAWTKMA